MNDGNNDQSQQFAGQFLNLWQEQMASFMKDPQVVNSMLQMMQMMQQAYMQAAGSAGHQPFYPPNAYYGNPGPSQSPQNSGAAGSADPAVAAGFSGDLLVNLTARLAACEERIAVLESRLAGEGKEAPKRRTRKKRAAQSDAGAATGDHQKDA